MFTTSIKAAVMQSVNAIIKEKQLAYDEEVRRIDLEAVKACEDIVKDAETKKVTMKEEIVESIISKFR